MKEAEVSIVLPTYNEAKNISTLIQRIDAAVPHTKEIIVVDDDSPDKTWEVVEKLNYKDVRAIRLLKGRNLVGAIQRGIDEAKGKYVIWMDADLSMPPEVIPQMIENLENYDIVTGSRYAKGGKDQRPFIRVASSRIINFIANIFLNFKVLDYDTGFVAARKEVLEKMRLAPSIHGEYCIELLYRAGRKGYKINEVPYSFTDRKAGESKTAETVHALWKMGIVYMKRIIRSRLER